MLLAYDATKLLCAGDDGTILRLSFSVLQAYYILDELIMAGEIQETSKKAVLRVVAAQVLLSVSIPSAFRSSKLSPPPLESDF